MDLKRRSILVYVLLALVWATVVGWQVEEHLRVKQYARSALLNRSRDIANTLGSFIRGLQFRGTVFGDRLQPVLDELVRHSPVELVPSGEVLSVALLNAAGEPLASAGGTPDLKPADLQEGEKWGSMSLTVVCPIEGAPVSSERNTNTVAPVLLPPFTNVVREAGRGFRPRQGQPSSGTNSPGRRFTDRGEGPPPDGPPPPEGPPDGRPRRPFWARNMDEREYQAMIQKRELHGLVLTMSTKTLQAVVRNDLRLRFVITFFASISVIGSGLAWRNLARSSDLQLRLVRASQQNTHLRELNLAAAGLAHETRNPLNIIRGLAQLISRESEAPPQIQEKSREIINEADKVAAQLNEFINYSRPREVRRTAVSLGRVIPEITRALKFDLEEKQVELSIKGDNLVIEADEQLLRQALFNLLMNAVQAVEPKGQIEVVAQKQGGAEATLEIRDNGPGVPAELRSEIFKPYFTSHKTGTGLGLAVVQQIVLAHGWEIECAANEPRGAIFSLKRLKVDLHPTRMGTKSQALENRTETVPTETP